MTSNSYPFDTTLLQIVNKDKINLKEIDTDKKSEFQSIIQPVIQYVETMMQKRQEEIQALKKEIESLRLAVAAHAKLITDYY